MEHQKVDPSVHLCTQLACLRLILRPRLFAAIALEHADRPATFGIEHGSNHGGLLVALAACSDRIRVVAGKDFVLKLIIHWDARPARKRLH
jgi:hypothetical protein